MTQRTHKRKSAPAKAPEHAPEKEREDSLGLERLIFFSDAVFAIAITLLALDIRLPAAEATLTNDQLLSQLLDLWPKYLSYIVSFLVIGSFWIGHHAKFRQIIRYDGTLLQLNLLHLMVIAFMPFPTQVLSEYGNQTSTIFYALTMIVAGVLSTLIWWYAAHGNRLVPASLTPTERRRGFVAPLITPAVFLLSIGIAFINDDAAKYSWLLIIPASRYLL